jgi:1-deoxy-D-xylulose-5-phosphate reductoisomerase
MTGVTSVSILGATGSIGASATKVIKANPGRYRVEAIVGGSNASELARLARDLDVRWAAIADERAYADLKAALSGTGIAVAAGAEAVCEAASRPADRIVAAIAGTAGLRPTCAALARGAVVALANKESMVSAGRAVLDVARRAGATILPLDSEHNSVFQAMAGAPVASIEKIALTASGGPFRTWSRDRIATASRSDALKHPNFSMGAKITIDSATMMNKGLEVIEAHFLFGLPEDRIEVLVHPQQAIHGLVYFRDGSLNAGMAVPDMTVPMAHCLAFPERIESGARRLDLAALGTLEFHAPDHERFPSLRLAREALRAGGAASTVLNAANEVAVAAFLDGHLRFGDIFTLVNAVMNLPGTADQPEPQSVNEAISVDQVARIRAREELSRRFGHATTEAVVV